MRGDSILLRNIGAEDAVGLADCDSVLYYRSATGSEIDLVGARMGEVAIESAAMLAVLLGG